MMRCIAFFLSLVVCVSAGNLLIDSSGSLRLKIPDVSTSEGVVAVIASPDTSSLLTSSADTLSLDGSGSSSPFLTCKGATLSATSSPERISLATTSLVADAILVDGLTLGDVEAGWRSSRHGRTLTALFRARVLLRSTSKQTIILCVKGAVDASTQSSLKSEVKELFDAAAEESAGGLSFNQMYSVEVVSVTTAEEADEAMAMAQKAAAVSSADRDASTLSIALQEAHDKVQESGVAAGALDPPHIAQAFVLVSTAYTKQARSTRAKVAAWKSRVARGLVIDGFGAEAESLRERTLGGYDSETLATAGLPVVAARRLEMRTQLEALVDSSIRELFKAQLKTLEANTLKKFRAQLLRKIDTPADDAPTENAAAMRAASFSFDNIVADLQVPSLSLTKDKPCREMEAKLTDELMDFPDSPQAKLKRTKKVEKVTSKEKKPGQRSIDFGLDLIAMLRPDGFGSFQGFAGYQLGGNSLTFGVHNDADDPQVISQFGGVRPPLLRVQPKLRVDVEL